MKHYGKILALILASTVCPPALGQSWQPQWTDIWGTPQTEVHVATEQPFEIGIAALWSGPDAELFDFEVTIDLGSMATNGVPLSYLPGSFVPTPWLWGSWDFTIDYDAGDGMLTITSSSPSIPWGSWVTDGESLPFGTLQFQAEQLNVKDYGTGTRTPWPLDVVDGRVFTTNDLSSWVMASGTPASHDVFTDGQRDLVPPATPLSTSTTRFAVSVGGDASVENTMHTDTGPIIQTDSESKWFEAAQAYRMTSIGTDTFLDSYAWSSFAGHDQNAVFSLEANAAMDDPLIFVDIPENPFTAHALAEIPSGNRLVMIEGTGGTYPAGTPMIVTVSVGLSSQTTPMGSFGEEGVVDWTCTVRLDSPTGTLLGTLMQGTETVTFTAPIGSSLYFEGYLEATATSGDWFYESEYGLWFAVGAEALSKLDIWAHTDPISPGDMDADGDVDLDDYASFEACLNGPGAATPPPACPQAQFEAADITGDNDVDAADFGAFQTLFTG